MLVPRASLDALLILLKFDLKSLTIKYNIIIITRYRMEKKGENLKKILLILIGISLILGITIFILYKNISDSKEEVVDIFKEKEKEEDKKEEKIEPLNTLVVDIKGMINNPGVYEVEEGKRVNDIIKLAGGLKEGADTSNINLAKLVTDEMTIIIYSNEEVLEKYKKEVCICDCTYIVNDACINNNESKLVNINTASLEELITINGIGKAKAEDIINYRKENGNFNTIDDIKNVPGIGVSLFEKIKDYITV